MELNTRFLMRILTTAVLSTILIAGRPDLILCDTQAEKTLTTEQWLEDYDFVVTHLKSRHPNPYYRITEEEFDANAVRFREEVKHARSDLESFFAIRRMIATVQDGHTQLGDRGLFDLTDLRFPFRLDRFTDGTFITVIGKEYEHYLGSRVMAINGTPIEEAYAINERITSMDSEFGRIRPALSGFTFARIMYGLGITDNLESIELELIPMEGEPSTLVMKSIEDHGPINWMNRLNVGPARGAYVSPATLLGDDTPLHLKRHGENIEFYWFEHLAEERAVYFQFNQVANQPGSEETFARFTDRFWSFMDEHADEIDKLIVDIRYNDGGQGRMMIPFVNQIIQRDFLNRRGNLFVLVGKRTYSAAVIFLTELDTHTNVIVLGDPPACPFNFFSDQIWVGNLPNSGFPFLVASRQVDNAFSPHTVYLPPDIPAPFSSRDYFTGKDPALEIALRGEIRTVEEYAADEGAEAAVAYYRQLKEKYSGLDWWIGFKPEILESDINDKGYTLLQGMELDRAFEVFRLNTMLFPESFNVWDSLGECCYGMKKFDLSLRYYRKSVEINPENENGKQMIARIKEENAY